MAGSATGHDACAISLLVIPAKAGIQLYLSVACKLDPGLRRGDE